MTAPISRPQVGKLIATLAKLGVHERAERLRIVSALVYRRVESTNDLTVKEARLLIDMLDGVRADDAPAERLARMCVAGEKYLASVSP